MARRIEQYQPIGVDPFLNKPNVNLETDVDFSEITFPIPIPEVEGVSYYGQIPDNVLPYVRCISCNKVIGHLLSMFIEHVQRGKTPKEAMDLLGLKRECCRINTLCPIILPSNPTNPNAIDKNNNLLLA